MGSNGCLSAGPHYNPFNKEHGGPDDEERHVGDLGNIDANAEGIAKGQIVDRLVKIEGEYTVIGGSFMVHADPDDLGRGDNSEPASMVRRQRPQEMLVLALLAERSLLHDFHVSQLRGHLRGNYGFTRPLKILLLGGFLVVMSF